MNRLMRAEWYRVRKTYHLAAWTVIFCIFITYIGYMDIGMDSTVTGMDALNLFIADIAGYLLRKPERIWRYTVSGSQGYTSGSNLRESCGMRVAYHDNISVGDRNVCCICTVYSSGRCRSDRCRNFKRMEQSI